MPFNAGDGNQDHYISSKEIHERLLELFPELAPDEVNPFSATDRYRIGQAPGGIGIIPAYSRTRCGSCNRIRLTPKGELLNCLYATSGLQLRSLLRQSDGEESDKAILDMIDTYLFDKAPNGHEAEKRSGLTGSFASMTTIGG
jgi:cyclic pyranopterin phosphate synthase